MTAITDSLDKIPEIVREHEIGACGPRRGGSSGKMPAGSIGLSEAIIRGVGWGIGPVFRFAAFPPRADAAGFETGSSHKGPV